MNQYENDLNICIDYHLSPNELYFIRSLLEYQEEKNMRDFPKLLKFCNINLKETILELQRKKLINQFELPSEGTVLNPMDIPVNKTFTKMFHRKSNEMGEELYAIYPEYAEINGSWIQINTVSKKFDSHEDAWRRYGKIINHDPKVHEEVLEVTKWAADKGMIACTLAAYIVDRRWEALSHLKSGKSKINVNYDNFKLL